MEKHLHIICHTVPYPVDYGGVYDLFYKLPALQQEDVQVHLHCFDYGRGRQPVLEQYCASVDYYERRKEAPGIGNLLPYIVSSRRNERLVERLLQDDHPILMEGIHCTALLLDKRFSNRKCFVRLHNVEYRYYADLAKAASLSLRKIYYKVESWLLYRYEKKISPRAVYFAVSEKDVTLCRNAMRCKEISYLPVFLPAHTPDSAEGLGKYCLYHADLSVDANDKAAIWLVKKVFSQLTCPCIIAGKNPSSTLRTLVNDYAHVELIANPSEEDMRQLVANAQVNVLPSYTDTGVKLKLLNTLFHGRHCVVNPATVSGSGLEAACHIATTATAVSAIIAQLYHMPFTQEEIALRKRLLADFDNKKNASLLVERIWHKPY